MLEELTALLALVTAIISLTSVSIAWLSYRSVRKRMDRIQAKMEAITAANVVEDESVPASGLDGYRQRDGHDHD